jgi:hypothetical protein
VPDGPRLHREPILSERTAGSELAAKQLRSLCWAGDDLIDWIGGVRIGRDGKAQPFGCGESYRFDAAVGFGDVGVIVDITVAQSSDAEFHCVTIVVFYRDP